MKRPLPRSPLAVAYGAGVDSTAMLVGFVGRRIRPDLITMADTGNERPETYDYLPIIQRYLRRVGFPPVTVVRYQVQHPKHGHYATLEEQCLVNECLPSFAYGWKKCSLKWKRGPQDKFCKTWPPAVQAWAEGRKVLKAIGYDAGPADTRRRCNWKLEDDDRYHYWYPLQDWNWDRDECKRQIAAAGLPVPMKSACWFCPAMRKSEILWLAREHPDLFKRAVQMEQVARNGRNALRTVAGLGRRFSWEEFVRKELSQRKLFV